MTRPLFWLLLALAGCAPGDPPHRAQGYVEGEFLLVAPQDPGRVTAVLVARGDQVAAGAPLFLMEDEVERAAVAAAAARLAERQAMLANARLGMRPAEIAVRQAKVADAKAEVERADREEKRQRQLFAAAAGSARARDEAYAAAQRGRAALAQAQAELAVAHLPARPDDIEAAASAVRAAQADQAEAEARLARKRISAPKAGAIDDILRRPGEAANAGSPVVSLLPPENRFIRFFVPQSEAAHLNPGMAVAIACDGCDQPRQGHIRRINDQVEYTPPVIFSVESRQKLVVMVEADIDGDPKGLHPGLPVDVSWGDGGQR